MATGKTCMILCSMSHAAKGWQCAASNCATRCMHAQSARATLLHCAKCACAEQHSQIRQLSSGNGPVLCQELAMLYFQLVPMCMFVVLCAG